ncbi:MULTISPECIES: hypothetical protein [unclassified Actinomyces]|uniref:hypothetical protein n=1 Tax=unclassified Actinomyces TaxID=2609248 RepID=UPI001F459BAD|nr:MULTISPECIES: hypothetical protein [unclassified Actinomyces]
MTASPAQAVWQGKDPAGASSSGSVSTGGDGSVTMAVNVESVSAAADGSAGSGGGATAWSQSVTASVHPVCWYTQSSTGAEKAKYIDSPESTSYMSITRGSMWDDYKARFPDYESYADDTEGHWYVPNCDPRYMADDDERDFGEIMADYYASNSPVYVPAGESAPAPEVDGVTLAQAAWDAVTIPTATIGYNPMVGDVGATVVGMDTWVWATGDTPKEVTVTATAGSTTATITATAKWLTLQPKDGTAKCTSFGIPWSEDNDAKGTDCKIVFDRSSAHFKDSVTPVDVKVSYAITYTATDGAVGTMDTHTTSATTSIPVAEIQTLNTQPTKQP